jgi:hypothetical protein
MAGQLAKTKQSSEYSFHGGKTQQAKGQAKLGIFALTGQGPRAKTRGKSCREVESRSGEDVARRRAAERRGK